MQQRLIGAAVLVPVVVILFLIGQPWLSLGIAVLGSLAAYETAGLVRRAGLGANTWLAMAAPALAVVAVAIVVNADRAEPVWQLVATGLGLWVILAAIIAFRQQEPAAGFLAWSGTLFAGLYPALIAFVPGLLAFESAPGATVASPVLAGLDTGRIWLLILVLTVWTLDSGAYLAGRFHGRGRFMIHISPNKTWSGAIGGTIAAVAVCAILFWLTGLHPIGGAVLGLLLAVASQAGDLAESMLKRAAGAKDSGTLIPGHGGLLDRVDSFLFAAPAMYAGLTVALLLEAAGIL